MYNTGGRDLFGVPIIINEYDNDKAFEKCIAYKLSQQGFSITTQVVIGPKGVSYSNHKVDIVLPVERILVEVKLQNIGGTVENKIAYEMWTYQWACDNYNYKKAYIVYGGNGFTTSVLSNLYEIVKNYPKVTLIRYEDDNTLSFIK